MKRTKSESPNSRRFRLSHFLFGIGVLYLLFISFKFPHFLRILSNEVDDRLDGASIQGSEDSDISKSFVSSVYQDAIHRRLEDKDHDSPLRPNKEPVKEEEYGHEHVKQHPPRYGRITGKLMEERKRDNELPVLERMADEAWLLGLKAWNELDKVELKESGNDSVLEEKAESCPSWISISGEELEKGDGLMFLPCGLAAGSSITVVGTPHHAHKEYVPRLAKLNQGEGLVSVSQFMIELQGLKSVDGEEAPKILHLNPRVRGDWSKHPVIEHNTCYRMHWGRSQRCDGLPSGDEEEMLVDGYRRCEKWMRNDIVDSKESKTTSWFKRFIGREQKPEVTWPFPFAEGRMFILTLRAGVDGYHINIGGRHVTSFPYRTNPRKEVNVELKKESAYFGDIVILPFMDRYELVVLKTVAICEFGINNVTAAHIMKIDDDTFIRVDTVMKEIDKLPNNKSLFMGNLNLRHRPLRNGKWAVTYEEWPEEVYPPYANGPAYVISSDIVTFILSQHKNRMLRLFKMEDVSMGMWVEQYNNTVSAVQYSHSWKFCQYGCIEGYYTAHYQSPRQMICLWDKLSSGRASCCNFR
ncbi:unnamed protein product [Lupinus luteus]|uniref:Galectin domain-containing protein n=1 Tax=Lupinus luteus TaxID=3873 RepID=A0AAV1XUD0_LUPLU